MNFFLIIKKIKILFHKNGFTFKFAYKNVLYYLNKKSILI